MDMDGSATMDLVEQTMGFTVLVMLIEWMVQTSDARRSTGRRNVHTSILQGEAYAQELLAEERGRRILRALGVLDEILFILTAWAQLSHHGGLCATKYVTAEGPVEVATNGKMATLWVYHQQSLAHGEGVLPAGCRQVDSRP